MWRETGAGRDALDELWLESNGSEGCYGGWEVGCTVAGTTDTTGAHGGTGLGGDVEVLRTGAEVLFQVEAEAIGVERGADALLVEAFWLGADGAQIDWEPVLPVTVARHEGGADGGGGGDSLRVGFAQRLRCPLGAARLAVRCGIRWSPRGRVRWYGWRLSREADRDVATGGAPSRRLRLGVASGRPPRWAPGTDLAAGMAANTAHFLEQCRLAGEAGVDLLCLPELMLVAGMTGKGDPVAVHAAARPLPGPWLEPFREVARAHRMGICFSVYERAGSAGEVVYNTALLLGRRGELIGTYRKVHLAIRESRAGIAAGHSFPVFEFDGVRVGMAICMDSTPAETARVLACQGTEVLLMPINGDFRATPWGRGRVEFHDDRWRLIQRAHAFDNHLYVVAARNDNRGSAITAPWGDILAYNDGDRDVIWADADLDDRPAHYREGRLQSILWWMRRTPAYAPLAGDVVAATAHPPAPALETALETI